MSGNDHPSELEIAVIGLAGRFPGARDPEQFWRNLCDGVESISFFSRPELEAEGVRASVLEHPDYVPAAAVLDGIEEFDAAFFGFTPREAEILDPQQRLFLECAWEALERAGYDAHGYDRLIGVYAGAKFNHYLFNLYSNPDLLESVGSYQVMVASDKDYLATRVSYQLGLTGPSVGVQTACSTSLVAVHLACQGLLAGECDIALAGGVSISVPQRAGYLYTEGGIMSPDGHCRVFDAGARGTVGGSGLGIVVLKRLREALADGDLIHAVIKGSAINNDGDLKMAYTAPSVEGQAQAIRAALELAEVSPETVTYVEAHGTGTALGDPVEIAALTKSFRAGTDREHFCAVGSVKSNIGHLDPAAGIVGLIKTVLMLERKKIPPSLHFREPNPALGLAGSPFYVSRELADWEPEGMPRRAGISSFGIGGTNAHAVLEEAPAREPSGPSRPWQLLVLSARTPTALDEIGERLRKHLEGLEDRELADVAYTLQVGRRRLEHRRMVVCRDPREAADLLAGAHPDRVRSRHQLPCDRPLAFLFPGQGAQYPGMGRELYAAEPVFRRELDRAAEILKPHLELDLRSVLHDPTPDADAGERLAATALAQPALFAVELALARLWMAWGIEPEVMLGHSVGEYVAAHLAGVFSLEDALALVAARGRLMQAQPPGAMLGVSLPEEELAPELSPELALAAINGPGHCVVSGPIAAVDELSRRLADREVTHRRLHTSHAFHSAMMEPALAPFAEELARVRLAPPQRPFFSNLTGELIDDAEATDPDYWVQHLRRTVRCGPALSRLWEEPNRILLEVGPGRALSTLARQHPERPAGGVVLPSLPPPAASRSPEEGDLPFLLTALGRLWLAGVEVDWQGFYRDQRRCRVLLPTYPFERRRYWIERGRMRFEDAARPELTEPTAALQPRIPAPGHSRPELETPYAPPRDEDERRVAEIWQALLGIEPVGIHDSFFELGGGSLLATQLTARIRETLGVDLELGALLDHPTVAGVAGVLAEGRGRDRPRVPLPVLIPDPRRRAEPFPLTDVQQAYWIGRSDALELGNVSTHSYLEIEVEGLELGRFQRALERTIERQDMLRAVFLPDGRQQILPEVPPYQVAVLDLDGQSAAAAEQERLAVRERMSHQVLPSDRWPLFEVTASRRGERIRLHFSFDFLIGDAWSLQLMLAELTRFYADPEAEPSPLELSFRDYVLAEESLRASELYGRALKYWRDRLATLPGGPDLPLAKDLAEISRPRFVRRSGRLEPRLWERLKARGAKAGLTPSGVVAAAYADALGAWTARARFTLSLTLFNRLPLHPQVNELIGDFTSLVLLEVDAAGDDCFEARAARLQSRLWQDLDHRYVSGVQVVRELARAQGRAGGIHLPVVFTSLLGLEATDRETAASAIDEGLRGEFVYSVSQTPQVLVDHQVEEAAGGLSFNWDVVEEAFPPGLVDDLFAAYCRLLERLAVEEGSWSQVERRLVPAAQLACRAEVNATEQPTAETTLHALYAPRAAGRPEAVAVVDAEGELSYGELERRSRNLAHRLRELGARPDHLVAVVLEKGRHQVAAVLAILRAGAAYLPIDPGLPSERLRFLLEHGQVTLALTTAELDRTIDWPAGVRRLAIEAAAPAATPPSLPAVGSDQLAYVIYTSGSTGLPKGVMIDHRGAVNTILDINRRFRVAAEDRVFALSALSFDLSVYDVFGLLAAGGAIVFPEPGAVRDPARWIELLNRHRVTVWNTVPALMEMLVEYVGGRPGLLPDSLRLILLSGDWIPLSLPERIRALIPEARVISLGGATEASIWSILFPVDRVAPEWKSIPYGRPMTNQHFHVLDAELEPRPVWVPGELYIGGLGVARGYWRDEDKTRAAFIEHPRTGQRLYRTGDLGRWLPDGVIEFLGREDLQVKIRGHRIELGEIEAALGRHPAVEAAVAAAVGKDRNRYLVAWVVLRKPGTVDGDALAEFLRGKLPAYMVPASFFPIAALPLTPNGKVDRRALEAVTAERPEPPRAVLTSPTPAAEMLCGICADLLGVEGVDPGDNFFELGGHSLLATRLISRIRESFAIELPLSQLFDEPTMGALASAVDKARRSGARVEVPPVVPVPREGDLPLSFPQQRLWFLKQLVPESPVYNVHLGVRALGSLEVPALARSLEEIVHRHEILRTILPAVRGRPVQVVLEPAPPALPIVDLSALPAPQREAELERVTGRELLVPFDFAPDPMLRARLFRLAEQEHVLWLMTHHIIWDDWSEGLLWRELGTFYQVFVERPGGPSPLQPLPVQYVDYAAWQRAWLSGPVREIQLGYWRRQLEGVAPLLALPCDRPRPAQQSFRGANQGIVFRPELIRALRGLSRRLEATLYIVFAAAVKVLLYRITGKRDLVVGTIIGNRNRPEIEGLIGFFVNTLALRTDLAGATSFRELVGRVRQVALDAYDHQELPFEQLVEELKLPRDLGYNPLTQVIVNQFSAEREAVTLPELSLRPVDREAGWAPFDLGVTISGAGESLGCDLMYATDLFDRTTMIRLAGHLTTLLAGVIANPGAGLGELPLLSRAEHHQVRAEWSDTASPFPRDEPIHRLFEACAERYPEAIAVAGDDEQLSYGELNARAHRLAHLLRQRGVGPDVRVGLVLERSPAMVVAMLGILKAGGAYLPLAADYPRDRLELMLADGQAAMVVSQQPLADDLPTSAPVVCLDRERAAIAAGGTGVLPGDAGADSLAYVIYTSGSTGRPKGVAVAHRAVVRLVCNTDYVHLRPGDRVAQASTAGFDAATFEIWGALLHGGCAVVLTRDILLSPAALESSLRSRKIDVMFLTTALFNRLVAERPGIFRSVRDLLFGGQTADPGSVRTLVGGEPPERLLNAYGPTECTTFASWHRVWSVAPGAITVPIGRPIANTTIYLLDRDFSSVPIGVAGELYAGGDGVARGYLDRPSMTAERFVPDPFGGTSDRCGAGGRLYRTGDLARWSPSGEIEFLGRLDDQLKIRGFRIEPGEIEAVLARHPQLREVAVVARRDGEAGSDRLVAYTVPRKPESPPAASELRAFLQTILPEYMIPVAFVPLAILPLTASGKVDRRALPTPRIDRPQLEEPFVAPRNPIEETLAVIWRQVLGVERIGVDDNFFELGGDSILTIQIAARAHEVGLVLSPNHFFQHQTVAELAAVAAAAATAGAGDEGPVIGPVPLAPIQRWFFELDLADPHHFNQTLVLEAPETLDPNRLRIAVAHLIAHHDALRFCFEHRDGEWTQTARSPVPAAAPPVISVELGRLAPDERRGALEHAAADLQGSLDLTAGPVLRLARFAMGPTQPCRLLILMHHLVVDGVSWRVLLGDLLILYRRLEQGAPPVVPTRTTSYRSWTRLLAQRADSEALRAELDFWLATGTDPAGRLPVDHPREPDTAALAAHASAHLGSEPTRALLRELPAGGDDRIEDLLLTALAIVLARWSGRRRLYLDLEGHGRDDLPEGFDLSRTAGWFTSIYPVTLEVDPSADRGAALSSVRAQLRRIPGRGIGYGLLRYLSSDPEIARRLRDLPRPEVSFNYLGQLDQVLPPDSPFAPAAESAGPAHGPRGRRPHALDVNAAVAGGRLEVIWTYGSRRYRPETVEDLSRRFIAELESLIEHCRKRRPAPRPDDFPGADIDQEELDHILSQLR